jgi:hypothetical protein
MSMRPIAIGYKIHRLLGYRSPVRTSHETQYVSATEPSLLMLYKICGLHGDNYEERRLLGCYTTTAEKTSNLIKKLFE